MNYISTRGDELRKNYEGVLWAGLADDGGLYVPESWPSFSMDEIRAMRGLSYPELACRVMEPFLGDFISADDLSRLVTLSYQNFADPAVTPLRELSIGLYTEELFHGSTLAFKDMALVPVGRQFDYSLRRSGGHKVVLGATSGDTGSSAIEACRLSPNLTTFILYPSGRTSAVQRRQMTTVQGNNVYAIAIEGDFDDCQAIVKGAFRDLSFKRQYNLTAVNSINWARIAAQIPYYFYGALQRGVADGSGKKVSFVVPTGNFGDVFAGYAAKQMGAPIEKLVIATNTNNILHRFMQTGTMMMEAVVPTHSPSMDIAISSNFERLLFDVVGRDSETLRTHMENLAQQGQFTVGDDVMGKLRETFVSGEADDRRTEKAISFAHQQHGMLMDPHTAVGFAVAQDILNKPRSSLSGSDVICLSTAHPAKFPEVVEKCTGQHPPLPDHLADLFDRPERIYVLPNDLHAVQTFIRKHTPDLG